MKANQPILVQNPATRENINVSKLFQLLNDNFNSEPKLLYEIIDKSIRLISVSNSDINKVEKADTIHNLYLIRDIVDGFTNFNDL